MNERYLDKEGAKSILRSEIIMQIIFLDFR